MKRRDFEKRLKQTLQEVPHGDSNLKHTIFLASAQASRRSQRSRIPFRRFLRKQIPYVGWQLWSVQGLFLLVFDRMITQLYGERFWDSPSSVARLLFCVSTLVSMMALPLLYRSRRYRMQEIESASYFSSARLLMAKLAVIGIGDFLLLTGMFLLTLFKTSMGMGNLTFCLLLPFLIMTAADLYMMGHCSERRFFSGSIILGTAMVLLAVVLPGQWLPVFRQNMALGTALLCLGLLVFSLQQLRHLLYRSPYAELQVS